MSRLVLKRFGAQASLQRTSKDASPLRISGAPASGISQNSTCIGAFLSSLVKITFLRRSLEDPSESNFP
jgi:hypothetical protein